MIEGWALTVLLDAHAIAICHSHGFTRDKADPDAWQSAHRFAREHPFPGATAEECRDAIDDIMRSIGDTCPECDTEA